MIDPTHRKSAGSPAAAKDDPLAELERVVAGKFERKRPAGNEANAVIDASALDFEAELIRQMDSPAPQQALAPMHARFADAPEAEPAARSASGEPRAVQRPRVTPVDPGMRSGARSGAQHSARASAGLLPEHAAPSLDSSLEDQLLGELGLDVELFGNVVKRKKPSTEDIQADQKFAEALSERHPGIGRKSGRQGSRGPGPVGEGVFIGRAAVTLRRRNIGSSRRRAGGASPTGLLFDRPRFRQGVQDRI
jgi:hypothetical protein